MLKAFICYANENDAFVRLAEMMLKEAGYEVWVDDRKVRGGEEWRKVIDDGISTSDVLLVVITPESCDSKYVTYEWAYALGRGIRVIPLLLEKADVHPRLSVLQHLDFTNKKSMPWERLFQEIDSVDTATKDEHTEHRALASEIAFNLSEIDNFLRHGYQIDKAGEVTANGKSTTLRYVTCMTNQFETAEGQHRIANAADELRDKVFRVYRGFREINTCADALKQAFRSWRASQYLEAINDFQTQHRSIAEKLINDL